MANVQILDPLASADAVASARVLRATPVARLLAGCNYLLGSAQTEAPLWQIRQSDSAGPWVSYSGAGPQRLTVAGFKVPALSDRHDTVTVVVDCAVSAGVNATVTATAQVGGAIVNQVVFPQARAEVSFQVPVDPAGDTVKFDLATSSTTLDIYGLRIEVDALADPLPIEDVSGVEVMGTGRAASKLPAHAATTRRVREATAHAYARLRRLWCWTGVDPALGDEFMSPHLHAAPAFVELGVDMTATVYLNVDNSAGAAGSIPILVGDGIHQPTAAQRIDVPAGFDGEVSGVIQIPERLEGPGGVPWETSWIGVWPGDAPSKASIPIRSAFAVSP